MGQPRVTTAADKRRSSSYLFKAGPSFIVRIRNLSMTTMVLNNLVPMPLLEAARNYEKLQAGVKTPEDLRDEAVRKEVEDLMKNQPQVIDGWNKFLQHYASVVVIEPRITTSVEIAERDDSYLLASDLDADELLAILHATPEQEYKGEDLPETATGPVEVVRPSEEVSPVLTAEAAMDFRGAEQPHDVLATPNGEALLVEAIVLDTPERETIRA